MNLQTLVYLCQVRGITPVLMTQANRITADPDVAVRVWAERFEQRNGISYPQYKEISDAMMDAIRSVARKNQIPLIDLAREIPQTKDYMYDIVHFNDRGSKLAAQIIARELKPLMDSRKKNVAGERVRGFLNFGFQWLERPRVSCSSRRQAGCMASSLRR